MWGESLGCQAVSCAPPPRPQQGWGPPVPTWWDPPWTQQEAEVAPGHEMALQHHSGQTPLLQGTGSPSFALLDARLSEKFPMS